MSGTQRTAAETQDLVITRVIGAPRARVFDAWTDPAQFAKWFGPHGSTVVFCEMDVRPSGVIRFCHRMTGMDDVWVRGVYREVVVPERLVFIDSFSNERGDIVERPGFPREALVTVTFADRGSATELTLRHAGLLVDQGESQGWVESLERLAEHVASPTDRRA
jgi:uncharacterized protein YndB with AHSA1/START domain